MKKLLIILMVITMASFLFTGCLHTAPEEEVVEEEAASAAPVLTDVQTSAAVAIFTDVTSTSTLYMNKVELGNSILVVGTAPAESKVQVYIDDTAVADSVIEAGASGLFSVAVSKTSLGDDAEGKTLHVTATETGLAESEASNVVTFTLDTDLPGISSIAATASADANVVSSNVIGTYPLTDYLTIEGANLTLASGTWTIQCLGDSGASPNVKINVIPGVVMRLKDNFLAGWGCTVTTTIAITARATMTFDEDVTNAGMKAGTYSIGDPATYKETNDTGYWESPTTAVVGEAGATYTITVYGIKDLAGNTGGTSTSKLTKSCTIDAASAISLTP